MYVYLSICIEEDSESEVVYSGVITVGQAVPRERAPEIEDADRSKRERDTVPSATETPAETADTP